MVSRRRQQSVLGWGLLVLGACTTPDPTASNMSAARTRDASSMRREGRLVEAAQSYQQAARLAHREEEFELEAECQLLAAECWLQSGSQSLARFAYADAQASLENLSHLLVARRNGLFRVFTGLGDLELLARRLDNARAQYEIALKHSELDQRDFVLYRLSLVAEAGGSPSQAESYRVQMRSPRSSSWQDLRASFAAVLPAPRNVVAVPERPGPEPSSRTTRSAAAPPIQQRAAWDASPPGTNLDRMTRIWRMTVHHTADAGEVSASQSVADHIHRIQHFHMTSRGWADIGYHFLIDMRGRIWEGRSLLHQGAHAGNGELNAGNIGVALLGDFQSHRPSTEQEAALMKLLDYLAGRYQIASNHLYTHQELKPGSTQCPGPSIQRLVDRYRQHSLAAK